MSEATASPLARPLTLPCGVTVPNRIVKSAMTEGLADSLGRSTVQLENLYRAWSHGGTGISISGNVMIDYRYLERAGNLVVDNNGGEAALARLAQAATEAGNQFWMQISHPGRQVMLPVNTRPVSPSEVTVKLLGMFGKPRALTEADIEDIIGRYAHAARAAKVAGFTGVQVHGAHGYLISQFLSPHVNLRDDQWGGSLENRARFLLRVLAAVRDTVGADFPMALKLNSADFQKGGFGLDDCVQVVKWLNDSSLDFLEISGGTYEQLALMGHLGDNEAAATSGRESTRRREAYFLDYARTIRAAASMPLCVTGGFRDRRLMEDAVGNGEIDFVGLARPLCVDPETPRKLLAGAIDSAPRAEDQLTLGLKSNNALLKSVNSVGAVGWFYQQIAAIANQAPRKLQMGLLSAFFRHQYQDMKKNIARKRALKAAGKAL